MKSLWREDKWIKIQIACTPAAWLSSGGKEFKQQPFASVLDLPASQNHGPQVPCPLSPSTNNQRICLQMLLQGYLAWQVHSLPQMEGPCPSTQNSPWQLWSHLQCSDQLEWIHLSQSKSLRQCQRPVPSETSPCPPLQMEEPAQPGECTTRLLDTLHLVSGQKNIY